MVVTLLTWMLAGLAFFLDLYRVPVLVPLAVWSVAIGQLPFIHSDHYFALRDVDPGIEARLEDPYAIASRRTHPLLTIVAIDGGGIQAAAWGARALTGIYGRWPDFQGSVRFISSVSGGRESRTSSWVEAESRTCPPWPAESRRATRFRAVPK